MIHELIRRITYLLNHRRLERELADEMAFHQEMMEREGRKGFGSTLRLAEDARTTWGWVWLDCLWQDLKYGARTLRKSPGFTMAAITALALGIGANVAIFSVVYGVLFRPLPYPEPGRVVMVWETRNDIDPSRFPDPKAASMLERWTPSDRIFGRWKERNRSFEAMAGFYPWTATLTGSGEPERLNGITVTPDFFRLLGGRPAIGRTFLPEEDRPGNDNVIMLGHGLWQRRFASDPGVLGRKILVDGAPVTIVGVMPAGFQVVLPGVATRLPEFFMPSWHSAASRGYRFTIFQVAGRLKPGISMVQAQQEMNALASALAEAFPREHKGHGVRLVPLTKEISGESRAALLVLLGAVGCVLLIACVNVANLLLARAVSRQHEISIRKMIGAARWQLVRQMLIESMLMAVVGGVCGLVLSYWGVRLLVAAIPEGIIPRTEDIHLDTGMVAFGIALSFVTGLLFGLVPAIQAGRWPEHAEVGRRQGSSRRGRGLHNTLVVSEIAITLVLLAGAGLLVRTFVQLRSVDLGFHPEHVLTVSLSVTDPKYGDMQRRGELSEALLERVQAIPGIEAAAIADTLPITGPRLSMSGIGLEVRPGLQITANYRTMTPDYFRVMGIPLKKGRAFTAADAQADVIMVNQAFIRRYMPQVRNESRGPLGRHLQFDKRNRSIIGVVGDLKFDGARSEPTPEVFLPHTANFGSSLALVVRSTSDPARIVPLIRAAIHQVNPNQPLGRIETMEQIISDSVAQPRFHMLLLAAFAALALVLAAVGVYGVIAYSVTQRTHEIGVRIALGAERGTVLRMVISQALVLALSGVAIGLVAAVGTTRVMASLLFGVTPVDWATFATASVLLIAVAVAASWLPARRAMRIAPMEALRYE